MLFDWLGDAWRRWRYIDHDDAVERALKVMTEDPHSFWIGGADIMLSGPDPLKRWIEQDIGIHITTYGFNRLGIRVWEAPNDQRWVGRWPQNRSMSRPAILSTSNVLSRVVLSDIHYLRSDFKEYLRKYVPNLPPKFRARKKIVWPKLSPKPVIAYISKKCANAYGFTKSTMRRFGKKCCAQFRSVWPRKKP